MNFVPANYHVARREENVDGAPDRRHFPFFRLYIMWPPTTAISTAAVPTDRIDTVANACGGAMGIVVRCAITFMRTSGSASYCLRRCGIDCLQPRFSLCGIGGRMPLAIAGLYYGGLGVLSQVSTFVFTGLRQRGQMPSITTTEERAAKWRIQLFPPQRPDGILFMKAVVAWHSLRCCSGDCHHDRQRGAVDLFLVISDFSLERCVPAWQGIVWH